ncbi:GTP-binding protein [Paenibacillus sp. XY044]|uniref:CobW family GTP-binding protein n=1 Tax=Paenibacillus sp. XY044 TaxID=2026089 RepID=UPI000B9909D7|nr:CobW family GTP-binding protein [Paenibacillus sp. XY044]OZB97884.1 cobalamin biosynthesis protein CobW [Paenibacillus sp. XY044]
MSQTTPIYILSGFLGSGKTTLLQQLIDHWQGEGLLPAVIMNEVGDVNLDGLQVQEQVPMTEMLSGCICCSIRGDLSGEIAGLIQREAPDVIVVEATGIANPMEILEGVSEAALYLPIDLKGIMTVVDSAHLLELYNVQKGKTYRLMQEQIRCASALILNKMDRVKEEEEGLLKSIVARWNEYAAVWKAVRCRVDIASLFDALEGVQTDLGPAAGIGSKQPPGELLPKNGRELAPEPHGESDSGHGQNSHHVHHPHQSHESHDHESHDHVMVYTHYFKGPVESLAFERLIANLPRDVYRAKGVLTFSDTASRFLFQYAFRESDFMKITPQGNIPDVAVFIGEHFSRSELEQALLGLEQAGLQETD